MYAFVDNQSLVSVFSFQSARSSDFFLNFAWRCYSRQFLLWWICHYAFDSFRTESSRSSIKATLSSNRKTFSSNLEENTISRNSLGGPRGHSIYLMSLDSNVQCDLAGNALHIKLHFLHLFLQVWIFCTKYGWPNVNRCFEKSVRFSTLITCWSSDYISF